MTDAGWAEKEVCKALGLSDCGCGDCLTPVVAKLLKAEHARAVRIVKAEIKRVKLDKHSYRGLEKEATLQALERVLTALQKGRA